MTAKWFNSLDTNSSLPTIGEQHRQNLLLAVEINVQKKTAWHKLQNQASSVPIAQGLFRYSKTNG